MTVLVLDTETTDKDPDRQVVEKLTNVAKSLGIDHAAIRKTIAAEQKEATPAKASVKKPARKSK